MAEKTKKTAKNPTSEPTAESQVVTESVNVEELAAEILPQQAEEISEVDYKLVIQDLNDRMLRAVAEAQNTRRRADIDMQNAKNYGNQSFAKDLLGVMDNLFRALDTIPDADAESDPKLKNIKDGIEITRREMTNVFERHGIKRVDPSGAAFDPNLHQAISEVPDATLAPGTVMQVLQAGYILKDRLLRPALVVLSKLA